MQALTFDAAGSNLSDCEAALKAIRAAPFPNLRSLNMRFFDPEKEEVKILGEAFTLMASDLTKMPELEKLALQGNWSLCSDIPFEDDIDTSPIFHGLSLLVKTRPSLTSLRLGHLTVQPSDLQRFLQHTENLRALTLDKLDYLSLQECISGLVNTPAQSTLQVLNLHLDYAVIPTGHLRLPSKCVYEFSSLERFDLTLNRGKKVAATADFSVLALYGSLFRCSQLSFPALKVIDMDDAFYFSLETARTLATQLLLARRSSMPKLERILYAHETPSANVKNIGPLLQECGVMLIRQPSDRAERRN